MPFNINRLSSFYTQVKSFVKFIVNLRIVTGALTFVFLFFTLHAFPQNKKELEKKKEQIRKDIEYTNQLLNQTRKFKNTSLNQLVTLNKKISFRSELITTINYQITGLDHSIVGINRHIDSLEQRMKLLKKEYGDMLYYAYKNQTISSRLSFIFSASDFNQAYKRLKYLQQLSAYRAQQAELVRQTQDSLTVHKQELQGVRTDKTHLLANQEKEKQTLDGEKKEQVQVLNNIALREKKLRGDLKEKQRQEEKLGRAIEEIIRKEIEAARSAAKKKAGSSATASVSKKSETISSSAALTSTPEALKLSNDFASNKGRLPWPVDQGFISSTFGRHAHPVWKDVAVNNNGVDINSQKGAKARAIFDGKVVRVIMVVDKYAVLVQHGEYFTLYSNLKEAYVKQGERVITKQPVGLVQTDDDEGKTEVHLEIWKGSNKMDPENWIVARR